MVLPDAAAASPAHGRPITATLRVAWPITAATETDLIEHSTADLPLSDGAVLLNLALYEIKTISLTTTSFHI
jgi:hypothetical protein